MRHLAVAVCLAGLCVGGGIAGAQPEAVPERGGDVERARGGRLGEPTYPGAPVVCKVLFLNARVQLGIARGGKQKLEHSVAATLELTGVAGKVVLAEGALTEVIDERGENVVRPGKARTITERQLLEASLRSLWRNPGSEAGRSPLPVSSKVTGVPRRAERVKGHAECIIAKELVKENIAPGVMEEAVEVAPGVTFLWTKIEDMKGASRLSYEVRVKRHRGEEAARAGLEPVFMGVVVEDDRGRVRHQSQGEQRVDTEAEYIIVGRSFHVPARELEHPGRWQVCVYDGLERVKVEFEAGPIELVGGEAPLEKAPAVQPGGEGAGSTPGE